jgi:hypothetical protein
MSEEIITQAQLDEIAEVLKPAVRLIVEARPEQDLSIRITCTPLPEPPGVVMTWEILLDGKDLPKEQEEKVTAFLRQPEAGRFP